MSNNVATAAADEDDSGPPWLSTDNDDRHRKETAPLLFGDGSLDLQDPEAAQSQQLEAAATTTTKGGADGSTDDNSDKKTEQKGYGSTTDNLEDPQSPSSQETTTSSAAGGGGESPDKPELSEAALASKPHIPIINACLWTFNLLTGIAIVASLCLIATQIIPLFLVSKEEIMTKIGLLAIALKVYISLFCLLFVFVELNLPIPFLQSSPLLQRYFSRGFVYSFVGLICVEEAYSELIRDIVTRKDQFHVGWAAIFMQISSWLMLGTGVIYMLLGICCLKRLKDKMREEEKEAWRKYRKDMKDWRDLYED